jgi:hypothetical protein
MAELRAWTEMGVREAVATSSHRQSEPRLAPRRLMPATVATGRLMATLA